MTQQARAAHRIGNGVVVTGMGAIAPGGVGREAFWQRVVGGRTAVRRISRFDAAGHRSRTAAECDFDPVAAGLSPQEIRRNDRFAQFALAASVEALLDSGLCLEEADTDRIGVSLGTAAGATTTLEHEYAIASDAGRRWEVDSDHGMPFLHRAMQPSSAAGEISLRHGLHGSSSVVSTGCTSGIDAIGHAFQAIRDGEADIMLAGAADAPISPLAVAGFDALRATSGLVLGEGGAVLVLEDLDQALAREAHIYCEVRGYDNRANAHHMTGLRDDGYELSEAIISAMSEAGLRPDQLDYIGAHGPGTGHNDRHHAAACKRALGDDAYKVAVGSLTAVIGHCLGAAGALELAACALAIDRGVIPPTAELLPPGPERGLDHGQDRDQGQDRDHGHYHDRHHGHDRHHDDPPVTPVFAREQPVRHALSVGSGFGGFQSAMVFSAVGADALEAHA